LLYSAVSSAKSTKDGRHWTVPVQRRDIGGHNAIAVQRRDIGGCNPTQEGTDEEGAYGSLGVKTVVKGYIGGCINRVQRWLPKYCRILGSYCVYETQSI